MEESPFKNQLRIYEIGTFMELWINGKLVFETIPAANSPHIHPGIYAALLLLTIWLIGTAFFLYHTYH